MELQVLEAFNVFQTYPTRQYIYDGTIQTFNSKGEYENGVIFVQVKATDKIQYSSKNKGYILRLDKRDLDLWFHEGYPVAIVLFDAKGRNGYYIELHHYFEKNKLILRNIGDTRTVFIPKENIFDPAGVKKLQTLKNKTHERIKGI